VTQLRKPKRVSKAVLNKLKQVLDLPGFNGETLTLPLPFRLQRQFAIGIQALNDAGRDCRSR
jgi:hypothetical protein